MTRNTRNVWISLRPSDLDTLRAIMPIDVVHDDDAPPKPGTLRVVARRSEGRKMPALHVRSNDLAEVYRRALDFAEINATARLLLGPYRRGS